MRTTGAGRASSRRGAAVEEDRERRDEEDPIRPVAERDDPAEDEPGGLRGEDEPPGSRAAELLFRDDRPEHRPGTHVGGVDERKLQHDPPEPGARAEGVPALAELPHEMPLGHLQVARQPKGEEEDRPDEVRGRVERERPARSNRGDQEPTGSGTGDLRPVARQPQERVRLLQQPCAHRLRHDPLRGGEEERAGHAADDLERDQVPDLGDAGEHDQRDPGLRGAGEDVGRDHHVVPRQSVRPDAADEDEEDLREEAGGQDEAEVRRRAGQVEDGERDRDRRERAPEERDRPADEEQAELPLGERAECLAEHGPNLTSPERERATPEGVALLASRSD